MVREQIAGRGIKNPAVLKAMRETPREQFIPPAVRELAYEDRPVPIGYGQTISQPYIVALMTEMLDIKAYQRVLEIGTGSGYQAAILSSLAKEVYTIEIVRWPEKAPFERIILTAAPAELPKTLTDQLKPGGKLVAPIGDHLSVQELRVVEKTADGKITSRPVLPVRFVPMVKPKNR